MREFLFVLILTGMYPLNRARRANRDTSLIFVCWWTLVACLCVSISPFGSDVFSYLSLCMIAAAIVALLGARRPHEGSWNSVVIGFLLIMTFPMLEQELLRASTSPLFFFLLAGILTLGCVNYIPTRLGPAAGILAIGCAGLFADVLMRSRDSKLELYCQVVAKSCFALAPWLAWWIWPRDNPTSYSFVTERPVGELAAESGPAGKVLDSIWLDFRDRYGLIWGLRVRDQFNRSAANAGWPVRLGWNGLQTQSASAIDVQMEGEMLKTLKGLLHRFMPDQ